MDKAVLVDLEVVLPAARRSGPPQRYGLAQAALDGASFTIESTRPLMIFGMIDRFIRELRRMYGK